VTSETETEISPRKPELPPRVRAFLRVYGATASIPLACRAARISVSAHYRRLKRDPVYAERFALATKRVGSLLEAEAYRRAHDGVEKPVYQGGMLVGTVQEYSDTLMAKLLDRFMRDEYKPPKKEKTAKNSSEVLIRLINEGRARLGEPPL
jgi:hypothetical protein